MLEPMDGGKLRSISGNRARVSAATFSGFAVGVTSRPMTTASLPLAKAR